MNRLLIRYAPPCVSDYGEPVDTRSAFRPFEAARVDYDAVPNIPSLRPLFSRHRVAQIRDRMLARHFAVFGS
jgi:hypothetical protein